MSDLTMYYLLQPQYMWDSEFQDAKIDISDLLRDQMERGRVPVEIVLRGDMWFGIDVFRKIVIAYDEDVSKLYDRLHNWYLGDPVRRSVMISPALFNVFRQEKTFNINKNIKNSYADSKSITRFSEQCHNQ